MPISKDEQYRIYTFGIEEGKELVTSYLEEDEDVIDVILEGFNERHARQIEDSTFDELKLAVKNFLDGVEDGIKMQLGRECSDYISWLRKNVE